MRKFYVFRALLLSMLLVFFAVEMSAQVEKDFKPRTSPYHPGTAVYNLRGNYQMIGNKNLTASNGDQNNSNTQMDYVNIDNTPGIVNSSMATLTFPQENGSVEACSEIVYAGLYWTGRANSTNGNSWSTGGTTNLNNGGEYKGWTLAITHSGSHSNCGFLNLGNCYTTTTTYTFTHNAEPTVIFVYSATIRALSASGNSSYSITQKVGNGEATVIGSGSNANNNQNIDKKIGSGTTEIEIKSLTTDRTATSTTVNNSFYATVFSGTYLNKQQVLLKQGNNAYQTITANLSDIYYPTSYDNIYVGYAEVTDYIRENGAGEYTVANIALTTGNGGAVGYFGGWGLIVIYENSKMKWRDIVVFDGYAYVAGTNNPGYYDLAVSGFHTAQSGDINMKLGLMAAEGDVGISGDYFQIRNHANTEWIDLSHTGNSADNFFNSSIVTSGTRNPQSANNYGVDIAMFDIPNSNNSIIKNEQTSTTFRYGTATSGSNKDTYVIFCIAMGVDAYVPEPEGVNAIATIDGEELSGTMEVTPGQEITYTLDFSNKGSEAIENATVTIPIPFTATHVSSSATYYDASNTTSTVTYNPSLGATGSIVWNIGDVPDPITESSQLGANGYFGKLTYTLKVTEDCYLFKNSQCPPTVGIEGNITGIGVTSGTSLANMKLIQGYHTSGVCEGEPITEPIQISINTDNYDCYAEDEDGVEIDYTQPREFSYCNTNSEIGIPFMEVIGNFPRGSRFYDDINEVTGIPTETAIEYTTNNNFVNETKTYYAVTPTEGCWWKFIINVEEVETTPDVTTPVSYCQGATAVPLTATASETSYTLYYYTSLDAVAQSSITPTTATLGSTPYYVAEGSSAHCIGEKEAIVVTVNERPTAPALKEDAETSVCDGEEITVNLLEGLVDYDDETAILVFYTDEDCTEAFVAFTTEASEESYTIYAVSKSIDTDCETVSTSALTIEITVNERPATPALKENAKTSVCDGDEIDVTLLRSLIDDEGLSLTTDFYFYTDEECTELFAEAIKTNRSVATSHTFYVIAKSKTTDCKTGDALELIIAVNSLPTATIATPSTNIINCATTSITLTATSNTTGVNYAWKNGETSVGTNQNTFSVTEAGSYTVTVTDPANGCSATSEAIAITVNNQKPTAGITNNTETKTTVLTCATQSISLTATGGVAYQWDDEAVTKIANLTVTAPGTYTVTVTAANGCTDTEEITISQNKAVPTAEIATPSTNIINCATTSITLTATSNTTGVNYAWKNGETSVGTNQNTFSATAAGSYTVTVTNPVNGCSATSTAITITQNKAVPTAEIATPSTFVINCTTESILLTATPTANVNYAWKNGETSVGTNKNTFTATAAGSYTVTVTDPANGCSATSEAITIAVDNQKPTAGITNNTETKTTVLTCATQSISLTATGGVAYQWDDEAVTKIANLTVTAPGTYTVTVTAANGCTDTESVEITQDIAIPTLEAGKDAICIEETTTLSSNVNGTWESNNTAIATVSNGVATGVSAGTATFTFTATNGCTESIEITVKASPVCFISGATEVSVGASSIFTAPANMDSYSWSVTEGNAAIQGNNNEQTVDVIGEAENCEGSYSLTLTIDSLGCESECITTVTVIDDIVPSISHKIIEAAVCKAEEPVVAETISELIAIANEAKVALEIGLNRANVETLSVSSSLKESGDPNKIIRTYYIKDECNNVDSLDYIVKLGQAPKILTPLATPKPYQSGAEMEFTMLVDHNTANPSSISYKWTLAGKPIQISTVTEGSNLLPYTLSTADNKKNLIFTATDECGRVHSYSIIITVNP